FKVDISHLEPGLLINVEWRGRPVWLVLCPEQALATLQQRDNTLDEPSSKQPQQPSYAQTPTRAIRPDLMDRVGICTHLGCSPLYRPEPGAADMGGAGAPGGFFCPCHGSRFDLAGRVFRNVPAPINMEVPPHHYLDDNRILIGEDGGAA